MLATRTIVADGLTPVAAYAALRRAGNGRGSFLLESVIGGERWGRYSILGYRPRYEAMLTRAGWRISAADQAMDQADRREPPRDTTQKIAALRAALAREADPLRAAEALFSAPDDSVKGGTAVRFARAHVGFFSWELVHSVDKVPDWPGAPAEAPLGRFLGGSVIVVFDGLAQTVTVAAESEAEVAQALDDLTRVPPLTAIPFPDRTRVPAETVVSTDDAQFSQLVRRAQEYIGAGDAFQIVLARNFRVPRRGRDPFDVYRAMRVINPSPYMYFLELPPAPGETSPLQIAGASPETLLRLESGVLTVRPLAGTRRRGKTLEEDRALEAELLADPKERAEHVMLIDLGRNDVGRVSETGSVKLLRNMEVEHYSHVMHIVSEVQGRVRPGTPALEVVRAAFPAGTLSGAPKVRAMQIIRELEGRPRGIYGGAIGYVAAGGDLDFAIGIRTAVCRDDAFEVTAGAGIVEASVPQEEADETRNKAQAVLSAIEAAPTS